MVQMLLDRKTPLEVKNKASDSPLLIAVANNNFECAAMLIQNGADVNRSNANRNTSLNIAASKGFTGILKILILSKKVDLEKANNYNQTPLHCALENCQYECAKHLIEAKGIYLFSSYI